MKIDFIGGAYKGQSSNLNAQDCLNLHLIKDFTGGKTPALIGTPGLLPFADLETNAGIRGGIVDGLNLYIVSSNKFYHVSLLGVYTEKGTLNSDSGLVYVEHNGVEVMVTDGTDGYIYDISGDSFDQIVDADFPTPSSLTYDDGYFIVTAAGTGEFLISGLYDGATWDPLKKRVAGGGKDNTPRAVAVGNDLVVLGLDRTYFYQNLGTSPMPYTKIEGATLSSGKGIMAPASAVEAAGTLWWLNTAGKVVFLEGYQSRVVSTEQIEYQISQYADPTDAEGFAYSRNGHEFYVLTFKSAKVTWCYDITTRVWHRRASYPNHDRHRAANHFFFNRKNIIGDFENGRLYEFSDTTYTDNNETIRRVRVGQPIANDRKILFASRFELEFEAGTGTSTGQGEDPQAMLEISRDGGHTWGNERWKVMGKIGEYRRRARWNRCGKGRDLAFRVTITDPVKTVIASAQLEARGGTA